MRPRVSTSSRVFSSTPSSVDDVSSSAFADAKGFITNAQSSLADVKLAVGDARRAHLRDRVEAARAGRKGERNMNERSQTFQRQVEKER